MKKKIIILTHSQGQFNPRRDYYTIKIMGSLSQSDCLANFAVRKNKPFGIRRGETLFHGP